MDKLGPFELDRVYCGHALDLAARLPDKSIQCIVTSPPYWGLRDYKIPPSIWGGGNGCVHEWGDEKIEAVTPPQAVTSNVLGGTGLHTAGWRKRSQNEGRKEGGRETLDSMTPPASQGRFCVHCNAWRGCLGLEPTPELYIEHLVTIFRELRRALRDDGTLWLNLGDSYWGGKGQSGQGSPEYQAARQDVSINKPHHQIAGQKLTRPSDGKHDIFKPKDLCGIPWRVALALQAPWRQCLHCGNEYHSTRWGTVRDRLGRNHYVCPECLKPCPHKITELGWWLRSDIIWCLSGGARVYVKSQKGVMPMTIKDMARLRPETLQLWSGDKWTNVKGISKNERKGDEIELTLRSGERISCTPSHKWPTERGVIQSSELMIGDVIKTTMLPSGDTPEPSMLPDSIGWFVGIYLAEGSRDTSGTIQIASHVKETARLERLKGIAMQYGGTCRSHKTSGNGMTICMDGKVLNAIIDTYLAGRIAKDKHLSPAAWQRCNSFLACLLRGYLDGDGHYDQANDRWRLGFTRNYNLESDLRTICARLGHRLKLKPAWAMIGDKRYATFRGEIRFAHPTHYTHPNAKDGGEIVNIGKARARQFYDIGVEDDPHLFALASGVLTHNSKPNPMPESVTDRPTKAHEYIFLLTKSARYFYDADAVREATESVGGQPRIFGAKKQDGTFRCDIGNTFIDTGGRNLRTVWSIPTQPTPEAHFATFPAEIPRRCIKAGTSEKGACPECGAPWERVVEKTKYEPKVVDIGVRNVDASRGDKTRKLSGAEYNKQAQSQTIGWRPTCSCENVSGDTPPGEPVPCVVLDPFAGTGRTCEVAIHLGRRGLGFDISQEYVTKFATPKVEAARRGLTVKELDAGQGTLFDG